MMRTSGWAGRALAGALFLPVPWLAPTATAATFAQRTVVTIDHTRVPDADLLPLANFPVLVSLTHDNLKTTANGGFVTSGQGHDILFRGEDGPTCGGASPCRLDHEVESYDGTTGTIVAWVRVPGTIFDASDGADTPIYMYYGDATVTCSQENEAGVWDASYREVFHLNEADVQTDSTRNAFTAAGRGAVTGGAVGWVGPAVDLASTATGLVPAHLNVSDGTLPTATSFTFEAWVKFRTINAGQYIGLVTKGRECMNFDGDPHPDPPDCTVPPCGDWTGLYRLPDGSGNQVLSFEWAHGTPCKAAGLEDPRLAGANVATGTWYHVAGSFDSATSTRRLLVNGTQVATDTLGACLEAPIPHYTRLGTDSNQNYLDGQLDEVRISFAARSNDWIGTGYSNQNAPYVGAGGFYFSIAHSAGPFSVTATACPPLNPCAGGPGTCYLRSIGNTTDYTTGSGSCTATNGSSVVSCPGAGWQGANRGRGDQILIDGTHYMVLAVDSESQLRLSTPFAGATGVANKSYTMSRQFATPREWENCISGSALCPFGFTVANGNLVTGNRSEIGIVYEKGSAYTAAGTPIVEIDGSTTDPNHTITLTADGPNRHYGVADAGVVFDNEANSTQPVLIRDQYVTVEWLEVANGNDAGAACILYNPSNASNHAVIRNNIVRNCSGHGIRLTGLSLQPLTADVNNNIVYRSTREAVGIGSTLGTGMGSRVRIFNNTFFQNGGPTEISTAETPNPYVVLRNNIIVDDIQSPDVTWNGAALCTNAATCDWWNAASGNNITGDAVPPPPVYFNPADIGPNPRGGGVASATEASLNFVNTTATTENLHIQSGSSAWNAGTNLTGFVLGDIDAVGRSAPWDIGADELPPAAAPPLLVWSDVAASAPRHLRFSTYSGGVWSAGTSAVPGPFSTGAPLFSKVARTHPNGTRRAAVASENDGAAGGAKLQVSFFDGTNWDDGLGAPFSDAQQLSTTLPTPMTMRHFDAAYEQLSGEILVASGADTIYGLFLWTFNGSAWSGNLYATPAFNGDFSSNGEDPGNTFRWVRLEPRPGTNQIAFIGSATDTVSSDSAVIHAGIWDGNTNTFGSKVRLSSPVTGPDGVTPQNPHITDGIDIDFVLGGVNAGEALATWGTQAQLWRRIWNPSTGWASSANTMVQDLGAGNTVRWIRQKAASNGDDMILAVEDVNERIHTIRYDGNTRAFSGSLTHTALAFGNADQNRPFDVAWDFATGPNTVVLVYSDNGGIRFKVSGDGGITWTIEQTVTLAVRAHWVQLERDPSNVVHLVIKDQLDDLRAWKWTGSAWTVTSPTLPSTNVETNGATENVEAFAMATWPPMASPTTAVKLMSFEAVPSDGAVQLSWQTGSELDNLGFHLYRGPSADGPWTRLTAALVPGLGSSPLGQAYVWRDGGLVNGQRHYYRLEDVDTSTKSTFHGPVSAVPVGASPAPPPGGGSGGGSGSGSGSEKVPPGRPCPAWVLSAYAQTAPSAGGAAVECAAHGEPEAVSLRELGRDARGATLELRTGGFYAVREPSGTVRVYLPGSDFSPDPRAPALPVRRALVDAEVGRKVRLVSAEAEDLRDFAGLRPSAVGAAALEVSADGSVVPGRRAVAAPRLSRGYLPQFVARLSGSVFQADEKSAVVEISPVRFDGYRQRLVLARRVIVRLAFRGVEPAESGSGRLGRRVPRIGSSLRETLARLYSTRTGAHTVAFEALFPGRKRALPVSALSLQRQGAPVGFHVEPDTGAFGPGSVLYFHADHVVPSTAYSAQTAWELVRSASGQPMEVVPAPPSGPALASASARLAAFETNRIHQPALLEAEDPWVWERIPSGSVVVKAFHLGGVDASSPRPAELVVSLQGASDAIDNLQDHHVRVSLNGYEMGETYFDGRQPHRLALAVPVTALREGMNEIALSNVGDTGVTSLVLLDGFTLAYPQVPMAHAGAFDGAWAESGTAAVGGLTGPAIVLDVTDASGPAKWLRGVDATGGLVRFQASAGRRYLVASGEGLLAPRVVRAEVATLRDPANQADYLLIAPELFLEAARPLVERRRSQGLEAMAVSLEDVAAQFGHGEASGEAIRAFVAHAYQSWRRPSPRYVVLLGDSSTDPRNFTGGSVPSPLPALWTKTSYLWTVTDPLVAAVNGDDAVPDLAIGRLPATTVAQAEAMVTKLLAWEDSGQRLDGAAALVADNPDGAGDFEAKAQDIEASFLQGRATTEIFLGRVGSRDTARAQILDAFNQGLSFMSYVGHGGAAVWAGENMLNSQDPESLQAQSRQPVVLTMNCLNGYFVAPDYESLSEALVKADGRGAIAAFSPSGLSLDDPAHVFHRAAMAELTSGSHGRLGDALLAAQRSYARAGVMPELLSIYHLIGDPATTIR